MTTPMNPYVAGNPVGGSEAFVGRSDVLREVLRVLRRPKDNALVLYGQRRIGKTSILEHLAAWLPREGPYRPVYFDLQDKAAWPLGRVLKSLAETIAGSLGQGPPQLSSEVPTSFRETWLPDVLASLPDGSSLVLLFDEFDVLAEPRSEQAAGAFFPYLRSLLTTDPGKLQFIFVIGRNVDDLDTIALSLFKGTDARRVSLLSRTDTATLLRLSEANGTLHWKEEAVERVWQLTNGHPFLTQQLCSHVWERAYDEDPGETPTVGAAEIDAAIDGVLDASQNTLEWLWSGLPPAERIVTSALAEAGPVPITAEQLEKRLHESGVRVVIRDLQNAPRQLEEWDILEPAADALRFRVELLRRWVMAYKPLHRVQEELDHIEPVAQNLYQAAVGLYGGQKLAEAVALLRQGLNLNPNHQGANQLLVEILLSQGELAEAREILERFYAYQPAAARPRLVQVLLLQSQQSASDDDRLALFEQVLEIAPGQPEADAGKRSIWLRKGEQALEADDLQRALEAFELAGAAAKVAETKKEIASRRLASGRKVLEEAERKGDYQTALKLARQLAKEFPEALDWPSYLSELEQKTQLAGWYREALGALKGDDPETARTLLARVIGVEPTYEEASRYLHLAVTGVDPMAVEERLEGLRERERQLLKEKQEIESKLASTQALLEARKGDRPQVEPAAPQEKPQRPPSSSPSKAEASRSEKVRLRKQPRRLYPWNPLDHLRLLWWILTAPQRLAAYRKAYPVGDECRVGDWLQSSLLWLPVFLPTLAVGLGRLPLQEGAHFSQYVFLLISGSIMLTWAAWGVLISRSSDSGKVGVLLFLVTLIVSSYVGLSLGSALSGPVTLVVSSAVLFASLVVVIPVVFVARNPHVLKKEKFHFFPFVTSYMIALISGRYWFGNLGGGLVGTLVGIAAFSVTALIALYPLGVALVTIIEKMEEHTDPTIAGPKKNGFIVLLLFSYTILAWVCYFRVPFEALRTWLGR